MSADESAGKTETQPVSEIEALTDSLTQRGLRALYDNPDIQRQVLENFEEKGEATSHQWYELKGKDGSTIKVNFGKRQKDSNGQGARFFERLITWTRSRPDDGDYHEDGFIGYKKGDHGMLGGLPDRASVHYSDPDIYEVVEFPRGKVKTSQVDTDLAKQKAEDFVTELETLNS